MSVVGKLPMKAPGCIWEFWDGVVGLSDKLVVFDGGVPVGTAQDLSERSRLALSEYMVKLWTDFGKSK